MKKILKYIGVLLAVYFTVLTCNTLITKKIDDTIRVSSKERIAIQDVIDTAKIMNRKFPIDLGDGRTIMNVNYDIKKNIMTYNYKYTKTSIKDLSQEEINKYRDSWKEEAIKTAKNNPNNKSFVIAKVTLIFKLLDIDDIEVLKFIITSTEYTGNLKPYSEKQRAIDDVINTARFINKMGDGSVIMNVSYDEKKNTMTRNYKFTEIKIKDLGQERMNKYRDSWKEEYIKRMKEKEIKKIKNNPNNKSFVTTKVTFIYNHIDVNGKEILTFEISPTEYK